MPFYKDVINVGTSCGQKLWLDQASLRLDASQVLDAGSPALASFSIRAVNEQCYKCEPQLLIDTSVEASNLCSFLWTPHSWSLDLIGGTGATLVSGSKHTFGEHGYYTLKLTSSGPLPTDISINIIEDTPPEDSMVPIYNWLAIFAALIIFFSFIWPRLVVYLRNNVFVNTFNTRASSHHVDRKDKLMSAKTPLLDAENAEHKESQQPGAVSLPLKKSARLDSLDTFRGISLCFMIFVNYGGGGYWFFDHAPWNGLTFADLLFPWFMWMQGVSMALSYSNRDVMNITNFSIYDKKNENGYYSSSESIIITCFRELGHYLKISFLSLPEDSEDSSLIEKKKSPRSLYVSLIYHSLRRTLILFGLGMFLANGYEIKTWRVPGVLQYFAVSNFFVTMTVLFFLPSTNEDIVKRKNDSSDVTPWYDFSSSVMLAYRYEWVVQAVILAVYIAIALGAKAPGCPRGYEGAGGLSENGKYASCTGGIHRYIDMQLFGDDLIYHFPTCQPLYKCQTFDPEGTLGSLSAVTLTYLGLTAGRIIVHFKDHRERLTRWAIMSFVLLLLAGILCGFSQNEGVFPVNKNLWSTSFIFVTAGFGLIMLSITYVAVDITKIWSGAPFRYLGLNSILIYVAHELLWRHFPFSYLTELSDHAKYLQCCIIGVSCWTLVAFYCYKIKFFVKI